MNSSTVGNAEKSAGFAEFMTLIMTSRLMLMLTVSRTSSIGAGIGISMTPRMPTMNRARALLRCFLLLARESMTQA